MITLVCSDTKCETEYAAMLALELEDCGLAVNRTADPRTTVLIAVMPTAADYDPSGFACLSENARVIICCAANGGATDDGAVILERPVDVSGFVSYLLSLEHGAVSSPFVGGSKPVFNEAGRTVKLNGREIALSGKEYELLWLLCSHPGQPVSRDTILTEVWSDKVPVNSNVADVYIKYVRDKIEKATGERHIFSVRGCGYMYK